MRTAASQTITVAAAQVAARLMNDAPKTLECIAAAIQRAAEKRVDLLVLPECSYPAYLIGSVESYRSGEHLNSGEFLEWLAGKAAGHRLHIVCGFVEDAGDCLYNAAVLLDDRGRELGRARKRLLWNADHDWFAPGSDIHAVDTALGRIGIAICAETRDPELLATLVADGAQLIAVPTCWINNAREPGRFTNPQVEFLIEARAREFGVPFVCADKWGLELGTVGYVGQSRIVRRDGSVGAEAAATGDSVIVSRLVLGRPAKPWVGERRRRELLQTEQQPAAWDRPAPDAITIAAVPTAVAIERFSGNLGEALFQPLQQRGVKLALLNVPHESQAEQMELLAPAFDLRAAAFPSRADVFELSEVRVGCVAGQWARSFAAARALMLAGAELLLFFDAPADLAILRARAIENRVYVAAANDRSAVLIDPEGRVLAQATPDRPAEAIASIHPSRARSKSLAPKTDILSERRRALYRY